MRNGPWGGPPATRTIARSCSVEPESTRCPDVPPRVASHDRRAAPRGRGRRTLPGPDPDRHDQLRRRLRTGGAQGGRVRRALLARSASEPQIYRVGRRGGSASWSGFAGADRDARRAVLHGHLDVVPATPTTGRSTRSRRRIRDGYVWGRGAVDMKDMDAMMLACVRDLARRGCGAAARPRPRASSPTRRPAGIKGVALHGRRAPRAVRRAHRGDQRGGRLQRDRHRPAGAQSAPTCSRPPRRAWPGCGSPRDGRAGPRLDAQRRERDHPARRGHRPDRRAQVAARVHPVGAHAARRPLGADRHRVVRRGPRGAARGPRRRAGVRARHPAGHEQPHDARRRLQAQRHPAARLGQRRLPLPPRPRGGPPRHDPGAGRRARAGRGAAP